MSTPLAIGSRASAKAQRDWLSSRPLVPPALNTTQQAELKAAVQAPPEASGIGLANWNWKVVSMFAQERFGLMLSPSSCLNYLHRLGFVVKRPKKRLLKADAAKREAFVAAYVAPCAEAQAKGAKISFVDEAHFRALELPARGAQSATSEDSCRQGKRLPMT